MRRIPVSDRSLVQPGQFLDLDTASGLSGLSWETPDRKGTSHFDQF